MNEHELEQNELIKQRIEKVEELKKKGINPYPIRFFPESYSKELIKNYALIMNENDTLQKMEKEKKPDIDISKVHIIHKLAGRVHSKRIMGKASFAHLKDRDGIIQLYASEKDLGDDQYHFFKTLDLGDHVGVEGFLFTTKTGEISIHVTSFQLLAKCIRPLPVAKEKDGIVFDAFSDKELRYRMRYVDLIVNDHVRETFIMRSRIISEIRNFLTKDKFLEVETPMMHPIAGGATAKPFVTHHNALDMQLYLRIAPELYLKRLIVGGMDRVFELNRNFRNEGISIKHNPEFTMMEAYMAYGDMETMLRLCERLIVHVAISIGKGLKFTYGEDNIDLTPPWNRKKYVDIIKDYSGIDFSKVKTVGEAKEKAKTIGMNVEEMTSIWKIADEVFSEKVEPNLIQPIFITDFPKELSPLAKSGVDNPDYVERFEPYIVGREIGNAFTELNDPFDQKARFEEQVKRREEGDEEAFMMDSDYIRALEYGMPPTGGLGIGIDRLVMLLTDSASIRDTIYFPHLRPE